MRKSIKTVDTAFDLWLEAEHPHHNVYDHDTLGDYHSRLNLLERTFNAGWKARDEYQ